MQYDESTLAQITSSILHHGEEQQLIFQCEKARISWSWKIYASDQKVNGFPERNAELEKELDVYYNDLPKLK